MAGMSRLIASGFGLGSASQAPGTAASFVAALLGTPVPRAGLGALAALTAAGGWLAVQQLPDGPDDPGWIVVDELAGQWVAMLGARQGSITDSALAFALFRLFDGYKLGPVGWADRTGGMVGVMLDDIVAGALSAGLLVSVRRATRGWRIWRW